MGYTVEQTVWVPMPDGTRLATTLWLPEGEGPFPAVLEFLPYRRGDQTAARDDSTYPHFAEAGIVGVRVDSRGQGDSDGLFDDEYSPQELQDCFDAIAWIAEQDWSNGSVGMMGISWGGFNGLQVAAMRPPALKAVISIASTADRYNDDIHYKGGALLSANVYWAGIMLSFSSRPPDPEIVGNRWAEIWRHRLENMPMLLETWLRHQHRDAYWQHGSICEDWSAIQCPVWVIAGWGDGYRNTPATLAAHLEAPVKAMTGPWIHKYPHFAWPKPRADFIGMACDWWHHWLSGEARGVEAWPDQAVYRLEDLRPLRVRAEDPGQWMAARPAAERLRKVLHLGAEGALTETAGPPVRIATSQHCGTASGEYFTSSPDAELPDDQRPDDALSECWQTGALTEPMDLMGRAVVEAEVSIDQPQGNLIARLCDVHPDGTSTLIARGVLNLCHRASQAEPAPMVPGKAERIALRLDEMAYRVLPGHRLRLAISTAYFPLVLPSPAAIVAELSSGSLHLPLGDDATEIAISEPSDPNPMPGYPEVEPSTRGRSVEHDLTRGRTRYVIHEDSGLSEHPRSGLQMRDKRDEAWEISRDDPADCTGTLVFTAVRQRGVWATRTESRVDFRTTPTSYDVTASLTAWEGDSEFLRRDWQFSVPRKLV